MQSRIGWSHQCRYERDLWREVAIQYWAVTNVDEDWSPEAKRSEAAANNAIRPALRKCFKDGPLVAARAQADYQDWMERSQDIDRDTPMPRGARRWLGFLAVWKNAVRAGSGRKALGRFQRLIGVDFGAALDRCRSQEGTD
jgi:hypothetical protein